MERQADLRDNFPQRVKPSIRDVVYATSCVWMFHRQKGRFRDVAIIDRSTSVGARADWNNPTPRERPHEALVISLDS